MNEDTRTKWTAWTIERSLRLLAMRGLDTPEKVWAEQRRRQRRRDVAGVLFDLAIIIWVVVLLGMGWVTGTWWVFLVAFWAGERWSSLCHVLVRLWRLR